MLFKRVQSLRLPRIEGPRAIDGQTEGKKVAEEAIGDNEYNLKGRWLIILLPPDRRV